MRTALSQLPRARLGNLGAVEPRQCTGARRSEPKKQGRWAQAEGHSPHLVSNCNGCRETAFEACVRRGEREHSLHQLRWLLGRKGSLAKITEGFDVHDHGFVSVLNVWLEE